MRYHCRLQELEHYYSYFKQTILPLKKIYWWVCIKKTSFVMTAYASATQPIIYIIWKLRGFEK